jgi:radical SAM superfamily enzyme with C-terminal helix-hairpin-helix motif
LIGVHSLDTRATANVALEVYRLVSIESTSAPAAGVGDDWLVYRIAQGANVVTGYRRGTRASVTFDVERIVEALNERLMVRPRRVNIRLGKAGPPKLNAQVRDKDLV